MTSAELTEAVRKLWPKWSGTEEAISNIVAALGHPNPSDLQWALKRHHANNLDAQYPKWNEVKAELRPNANRSDQPRDGIVPEFAALLARNREAAPIRLAQASDQQVFEAFVDAQVRPLLDGIDRANREGNDARADHIRAQIAKVEARERRWARGIHRAAGIEPPAYLADPTPETNPIDQIPF